MKGQLLNRVAVYDSDEPYADDVADEQDLLDIAKARDEYKRGEATSHEDIDWS